MKRHQALLRNRSIRTRPTYYPLISSYAICRHRSRILSKRSMLKQESKTKRFDVGVDGFEPPTLCL